MGGRHPTSHLLPGVEGAAARCLPPRFTTLLYYITWPHHHLPPARATASCRRCPPTSFPAAIQTYLPRCLLLSLTAATPDMLTNTAGVMLTAALPWRTARYLLDECRPFRGIRTYFRTSVCWRVVVAGIQCFSALVPALSICFWCLQRANHPQPWRGHLSNEVASPFTFPY